MIPKATPAIALSKMALVTTKGVSGQTWAVAGKWPSPNRIAAPTMPIQIADFEGWGLLFCAIFHTSHVGRPANC